MKRASEETVQEFSAHFMRVYNSIPAEVQPPPRATQLRYADSFDNDFTLLLRERRSDNLDAIMSDTIKIEVKLITSRKIKQSFNIGRKKHQGDAQQSTSRPLDDKFDLMIKMMEKMMEIMSMRNKTIFREQHDLQPRNQNLRRGLVPQIRQREHRDQGDQQIRPLFQNNYVDEYFDQMIQYQMHFCNDTDTRVFLTMGEHDQYISENDDIMLETDDTLSWET
jgi:hypothetical protein